MPSRRRATTRSDTRNPSAIITPKELIGTAFFAHSARLLGRIAKALAFPAWFGGNWDALEDCLTDLSWSDAGGHVLLIEGAQGLPKDETGIFIDILASAAAWWAGRQRPFFAVFVGGAGALPAQLPDLYRRRA